jgi:predicted MFS family arabinose efflux permease
MVAPALGGFIFDRSGPFGVVGFIECILLVDLILRLLMNEPPPAVNTLQSDQPSCVRPFPDDTTPLIEIQLGKDKRSREDQNIIFRLAPILNCFEDPSLLISLVFTTINAALVGGFNATIPLHAKDHFGLDATGAGLTLLPIAISRVVAGPIGGRLVDQIGSRKVAVVGYTLLASSLFMFRFISIRSQTFEIIAFAVLLSACGTGMAIVGPATWIEGMTAVRKYHHANTHLFWVAGPYASLQAINNIAFEIGLLIGPLIAGGLREW